MTIWREKTVAEEYVKWTEVNILYVDGPLKESNSFLNSIEVVK